MAELKDRIAVVVVHGMGNQFPMDTLGGFVDAIKPGHSVLYSSPNRITDEKETRRLSFNSGPYDFYEYYWAHYIEEPGIIEIAKWTFTLLFRKTPSLRLKPYIGLVRLLIISILVGIAATAFLLYHFFKKDITNILSFTLFGTSVVVIIKLLWEILSGTVAGKINESLGDVIKYTVPSPKNIATREQIRKSGIELLKNLHEAKTEDGNFKYGKIIVVAHSLGTIVAYDILTSLFAQYHRKFSIIPQMPEIPGIAGKSATVIQEKLEELRALYNNPDHKEGQYQQLQAALFDEYRKLTNEWRVSNFITMGSPLTHAAMILAPSANIFQRKKDQREFPVSPPQLDHEDDHFAFPATYPKANGEKVKVKNLHHAAHFAETQWTNIYFENDWIGGSLSNEFGNGILDMPVKASSKWVAALPLASHTKYWDVKHTASLNALKEIFNTIHEL
ncbi:MAG: hypothetical protein ABIR15_09615 [Chitinophagaceae bacterium]